MLMIPETILTQRDDEAHRQAYNAAFEELGLSWYWDPVTYACLPQQGRAGLRDYLLKEQSHLLRAYDADFLVDAIETAKERCYQVMVNNRRHGVTAPRAAMQPLAA